MVENREVKRNAGKPKKKGINGQMLKRLKQTVIIYLLTGAHLNEEEISLSPKHVVLLLPPTISCLNSAMILNHTITSLHNYILLSVRKSLLVLCGCWRPTLPILCYSLVVAKVKANFTEFIDN